jgi:hypothetical protein
LSVLTCIFGSILSLRAISSLSLFSCDSFAKSLTASGSSLKANSLMEVFMPLVCSGGLVETYPLVFVIIGSPSEFLIITYSSSFILLNKCNFPESSFSG